MSPSRNSSSTRQASLLRTQGCALSRTLALLALFLTAPLTAQIDTAPIAPHRYLVLYRNAAIPGNAEANTRSVGARLIHRIDHFGIAAVQSRSTDDAATLRQLAAQPNVEYVLHDHIVSAQNLHLRLAPNTFSVTIGSAPSGSQTPYDTYYATPQSWAVRQVGGYGHNVHGGPTRGPWDITQGKGVRIAILDSGVDANHPDISPNLALNLSEIDQTAYPSPCDDGSPQDQQGHGTWTASLAAGAIGPGTGQVIGVAPAATILNIKILERMPTASTASLADRCASGQASGLLSWVLKGIDDAISNRADVISLSVGALADLSSGDGAGLKAAFDRVTYAAAQANIVLVAAAGNDGIDLSNPRYVELPAQSRGVLAIVASTNPACAENTFPGAACAPGTVTLAFYSNHGLPDALAAPGGSYPVGDDQAVSGWIRGACSSGKPSTIDGPPADAAHSFGCFDLGHAAYVQAMGTSASAPLAAGAAALLRAAHPDWNAAAIIATLRSTAVSAPGLPVPQINAAAALAQP